MNKKYDYEVKLRFSGNIEAEDEPDALEKLQEEFKQEYGLEPTNDEVELSLNE